MIEYCPFDGGKTKLIEHLELGDLGDAYIFVCEHGHILLTYYVNDEPPFDHIKIYMPEIDELEYFDIDRETIEKTRKYLESIRKTNK